MDLRFLFANTSNMCEELIFRVLIILFHNFYNFSDLHVIITCLFIHDNQSAVNCTCIEALGNLCKVQLTDKLQTMYCFSSKTHHYIRVKSIWAVRVWDKPKITPLMVFFFFWSQTWKESLLGTVCTPLSLQIICRYTIFAQSFSHSSRVLLIWDISAILS